MEIKHTKSYTVEFSEKEFKYLVIILGRLSNADKVRMYGDSGNKDLLSLEDYNHINDNGNFYNKFKSALENT